MEIASKSSNSEAAIWKEIEVSESYLVCCMYEEAASLASSILERIGDENNGWSPPPDMLESTCMVLVQSLNQLSRSSDILCQLRLHFISLKAIPPRVLLTGACFQIAQDSSAIGIQEFLEEYLNGWTLEDAQYSAVITGTNVEGGSRDERRFVLGIDEYLQVVEVYVVTLLATVLKDVDLAISWVENASLPDQNRQGLLRRLHSMHSLKSSSLSPISSLQSSTNNNEAYSLKEQNLDSKKYNSKKAFPKLSERLETCFWCFRAINLKIGTAKFVITSGKIMLGLFIVFIYFVFRKKRATLKRIVGRQVIAVKRALIDLWKLAFSYEVNPLAVVQPLAAATRQAQ